MDRFHRGVWKIVPEGNCPPVRVRVTVRVRFRAAIFLEPM